MTGFNPETPDFGTPEFYRHVADVASRALEQDAFDEELIQIMAHSIRSSVDLERLSTEEAWDVFEDEEHPMSPSHGMTYWRVVARGDEVHRWLSDDGERVCLMNYSTFRELPEEQQRGLRELLIPGRLFSEGDDRKYVGQVTREEAIVGALAWLDARYARTA